MESDSYDAEGIERTACLSEAAHILWVVVPVVHSNRHDVVAGTFQGLLRLSGLYEHLLVSAAVSFWRFRATSTEFA